MARRPVNKKLVPKAPAVSENVVLGHYDDGVQTHLIEDAENMIVIGEKSPIWRTKKLGGRATFVTLKPPPDATDQVIDELKSKLYAEHGARVVHVHSRTKALTVVTQEAAEEKQAQDLRAVVMAMVDKANTKNRDALRERIECGLASAGL